MLVVVVLGAVQMFVLALLGEYIGRLYNEAKRRPLYIVDEIIGSGIRQATARLPRRCHREQGQARRQGQAPGQITLAREQRLKRGVERRRRELQIGLVLAAAPSTSCARRRRGETAGC